MSRGIGVLKRGLKIQCNVFVKSQDYNTTMSYEEKYQRAES